MQPLLLAAGLALLGIVIVDLLWTTLWVDGGSGPLSSRLTSWVWRGLRRASGDDSRILSLAGPLIMGLSLAMWIGLLWLGWTLLFAGGSVALVSAHTGEPADWIGRFYYVAYTMFTNGNGDYTPTSGRWEIASSLTTATGMAFVTLAVSYVLSVLGAVSQKRSFASDVTGVGERGEAFVRTSWSDDGDVSRGLELSLESLSSQLSLLAQQHKSYPILHYYHSEQSADASAVAVPILDEALTLYRHGLPDDEKPDPMLLEDGRSSVGSYLETLETAFIEPAEEAPPPSDLDRLREDGIPTVSDGEFEGSLEELRERRRKLRGVLEADAWEWPPVDD
ncbi:two pore domain potassium channel family protein [Natrarchaeobius halalkaliphilus]|uniref:Two pore domain potassium channel family protein n=1 Tax=Natrarchaeobius halalkaliphilus TaxID=1679091 RepID=A0A3N6LTA3_9EURY|nr:potassium channel family protein [Natrarchaeobius halalkaliphilus]RQG93278.1 two pore domain potassium channel family protein [Natrarchaeobius halalkaliphilus]